MTTIEEFYLCTVFEMYADEGVIRFPFHINMNLHTPLEELDMAPATVMILKRNNQKTIQDVMRFLFKIQNGVKPKGIGKRKIADMLFSLAKYEYERCDDKSEFLNRVIELNTEEEVNEQSETD